MKNAASRPANAYLVVSILILICAVAMAGGARTSEGGVRPHAGAKGAPQEKWMRVKKSSFADEPIKIVKVKAKGKEIKLNEKFDHDDPDWLRDFTLTVENTSDKAITHINFALFFPPRANGATGGTSYTFELRYGLTPQS